VFAVIVLISRQRVAVRYDSSIRQDVDMQGDQRCCLKTYDCQSNKNRDKTITDLLFCSIIQKGHLLSLNGNGIHFQLGLGNRIFIFSQAFFVIYFTFLLLLFCDFMEPEVVTLL